MNPEMYEFALNVLGYDVPEVLHMRAPHGQTVLNPSIPWYDRHVTEIKQRFPSSSYSRHPELTRGRGAIPIAFVYANAPAIVGASILLAPAAGMATATSVYPTIAGAQYQSAMSGQPSIGVDFATLQQTSGSRRGYAWYQLGYWRGY